MSKFYNDLAKTALDLIKDYGSKVVLSRYVNGDINPVTGEQFQAIDQSVEVNGVLLNYESSEIDGTNIISKDKKLLIDATEIPRKTDKPMLKDNFESLGTIVGIKEINPAGVPIAYFLQMRK